MDKRNKAILLILAAIALLIYFMQPFYTWFAADDYCYMGKVQSQGIISGMWHEYMNWDGRSISLTFPVCRLGLFFGKHWIGPLLGSALLMFAAFLILKTGRINFSNKKDTLLGVIILTATLWLAIFNISAQTLYWTTGIGYNMDIVMLLAAYWLFVNWSGKTWNYLLAVPVFFYAGTASPNGVLALLFMLFIHFIKEQFIDRNISISKYCMSLFIILTAFVIVIIAPGNANRLNGIDKANFTHIWTIYFNVKSMINHLWEFNTPIVWMMLIFGTIGGWFYYKQKMDSNKLTGLKKWILVLYSHRWLVAAALAFIFFLPFPSLHAPRTNIQFVAFITLYFIIGLQYIPFNKIFGETRLFLNLKILVLILFIGIGASQAFDARYCKNQLALRHQMLQENKGKDVVLTAKDVVRPPGTRRFEDISDDSSYWLNECVAQRYGLKSIKMNTKLDQVDYYKSAPKAKQMK